MERNNFFDSLKFTTIFLVILGHCFELYKDENETLAKAYTFLYTFHMPVFAFVSGYFTKNFNLGKINKGNIKLLETLIVCQLIWVLYPILIFNKEFSIDLIISPKLSLWYLLSLIFWRYLSFLIVPRIEFKKSIIYSIIFALLVGFLPFIDREFSLSRTFVLFPFFLAGSYCREDLIFRIKQIPAYIAIIPILASLIFCFYFVNDYQLINKILYGSKSYQSLNANIGDMALYRLFYYPFSFAMIIAVIKLTPTVKLFVKYGKVTLILYIYHSLIVFDILPFIIRKLNLETSLLNLSIIAIVITVLLCVISNYKIFTKLLNPISSLKSN